jgi:hypothetical protein
LSNSACAKNTPHPVLPSLSFGKDGRDGEPNLIANRIEVCSWRPAALPHARQKPGVYLNGTDEEGSGLTIARHCAQKPRAATVIRRSRDPDAHPPIRNGLSDERAGLGHRSGDARGGVGPPSARVPGASGSSPGANCDRCRCARAAINAGSVRHHAQFDSRRTTWRLRETRCKPLILKQSRLF